MKKRTVIIGLVMLTMMANLASSHAEEPSSQKYEGNTDVLLNYTGVHWGRITKCATLFWFFYYGCVAGTRWGWTEKKQDRVATNSNLTVSSWGEGKVLINYSLEPTRGCGGIQKTYIGFQTAYNNYDLYERTADQTDVDPARAVPNAQLVLIDGVADLHFMQNFSAYSVGDDGTSCSWGIGTDGAIQLGLKD